MRRLMLGAATAAIAITAGCSALGSAAFQQPIVNLKDVAVQGVGLTGGQLAVKLKIPPVRLEQTVHDCRRDGHAF